MPFQIPNEASAAVPAQAQIDAVDIDIMAAGSRGTGVTSGCTVTSTGAANGSVTTAAGVIRVADQLYTVTGNTVVVTANATSNPRFDLVTVGSSGTPVVTAGTAATAPMYPAVPAGSVALAAVYVPNGHTTGTTIPANYLIDKRVIVPATMAAPVDNSAYYSIVAPDDDRATLRIYGGTGGGAPQNFQIFEIMDYIGAPIAWINTAGGFYINDILRTAYSVLGPYPFAADIYGYMWRGTQASYVFAGPPGNMLSWADACHEAFEYDRAPTLGNWSVVGGATIATFDLGAPPTGSPTTYRTGIRLTATGVTPWLSQPGGAFALSGAIAGETYSAVAWIRSNTSAATRTFRVRLTFYNAAGTQQGADVDGTVINVPNTGAWTKLSIDGTAVAPATTTRVQLHIIGTSVSGEKHDVCGTGIMRNQPVGVFAPPFVGQAAGGGPATVEGIALAGDRWTRTDTPAIPGQREYICTTGGSPFSQQWIGLDASSLYRVTADLANSTTTMASIPGLAVAVEANTSYMMQFTVAHTSAAATTGIQFGVTGPASPTSVLIVAEMQQTGTTWQTATATAFGNLTAGAASVITVPNLNRVTVMLRNGANAGVVQVQFASEVAASAVTVKNGSIGQVT